MFKLNKSTIITPNQIKRCFPDILALLSNKRLKIQVSETK